MTVPFRAVGLRLLRFSLSESFCLLP